MIDDSLILVGVNYASALILSRVLKVTTAHEYLTVGAKRMGLWRNLFGRREVKVYLSAEGEELSEQEYLAKRTLLTNANLVTPDRYAIEVKSPSAGLSAKTIKYRPDLVLELEDDHRHLVQLYLNIGEFFAQRKFPEMKQELKRFKADFNTHIVKENLYFYVYLEQTMGQDDENREIIRDFRREMNHIARLVRKFIVKHIEADFRKMEDNKQFKEDYESIKSALVDRIESEENSLYNLYAPPEYKQESIV